MKRLPPKRAKLLANGISLLGFSAMGITIMLHGQRSLNWGILLGWGIAAMGIIFVYAALFSKIE
jgi:hypothetical protein